MKKYVIIYWFNSIKTEWSVTAESENDAVEKFEKVKGSRNKIINVKAAE